MEAHINSIDLSSLSSLSLLLLLVPSAILFLYAKHGKRKSRHNLPPGSMGWPFIGETFALLKRHTSFSLGHYLQNHIHRYGKIFKSNIFGKPTVVSTDAGFNRFVLQNEGRLFESSYPESVVGILGEWSVLTLTGEPYKEVKSIAIRFLNNDLRTRFLPDIEQTALLVINSWKDGSCLSATEQAKKFTFYMMVKQILGLEPGQPETEKIKKAYTAFMPGVVSAPLKLPGTPYWKALKSRSVIFSEIDRMVDLSTKEIKQGEIKGKNDLLSWCLTEYKLSKEKMYDLLLGMLFGGFETTSVAVSLAIFFLGRCPEAFQELRNEHLGIARKKAESGETKLNWEDFKQMEFTECVVKETLRLGNVIKFTHRKAIQDVHYQGYDIPCDWKVLLVLSAIHLDESVHKDPQEFNPWRWQNKSASTVDFLPFGGGSRMCAGAELAKLELAVFLHHSVLNYRWELSKNDEPLAFPYVVFEEGLPMQVFKINN